MSQNVDRFFTQLLLARLIDARERQVVALLKLVAIDNQQSETVTQEQFLNALLAVRRKGIELMEGYTTLMTQQLSGSTNSDRQQAALDKATQYMARHMAQDLTSVATQQPYASWLGIQLRLNPFISTHRINGSLAVTAAVGTQVDEQALQRNVEGSECGSLMAATIAVRQELLMSTAEFRRCCDYGDLVWQAFRSVRQHWVVDQGQQTGEEDNDTELDEEAYDMTQVLELCDNIRQQTMYIKQKVQETTRLYDMCKVAELYSAWKQYAQQQLALTRRRIDRERFVVCSTLYAWSDYTSKMKRLRLVQRRVLERVQTQIVHAWRGAIVELKKPKLLRQRIILNIAKACFVEWKKHTASSTAVRTFHQKRRRQILSPYFHAIQSFAILQQYVLSYSSLRCLAHILNAWLLLLLLFIVNIIRYSLYRRLEHRTKLSFAEAFLLQSHMERWKEYLILSAALNRLERTRKRFILRNAKRHWYKRTHNFVMRFIRYVRRLF